MISVTVVRSHSIVKLQWIVSPRMDPVTASVERECADRSRVGDET